WWVIEVLVFEGRGRPIVATSSLTPPPSRTPSVQRVFSRRSPPRRDGSTRSPLIHLFPGEPDDCEEARNRWRRRRVRRSSSNSIRLDRGPARLRVFVPRVRTADRDAGRYRSGGRRQELVVFPEDRLRLLGLRPRRLAGLPRPRLGDLLPAGTQLRRHLGVVRRPVEPDRIERARSRSRGRRRERLRRLAHAL